MYGRINPVLRHFGADELATLGTLQAIEDRRMRGEYVAPSEMFIPRPTPEFEDFFEFDRPVASGLAPHARDLLVEDMLSPASGRAGAASVSYDGGSPGAYSPAADPTSAEASPPPGSYDSSPQAAYRDQGVGSSGSMSGSGAQYSPHQYAPHASSQRRPYAAYPSRSISPESETSPGRSSDSRGATTPRRSYNQGPSIEQPPFRAGVPVTRGAGAGGRTTSSSAGASRSPSPSQPLSSDPVGSDPQMAQQPSDVGSDGVTGRAAARGPRGIAAKISGRPTTAGAGRGAGRSASPSPRASRAAGVRGSSSVDARGGGAAAVRSNPRVPAWAPAAGIANMRLDDVDEATRVALMLNDPGVRQEAGALLSPRGQPQPQSPVPPLSLQGTPMGHPGGSPGPAGASASPGYATRASDMSEEFFGRYRLRKHREADGVPDYRFSQPRSHGAHVPVQQRYFSFDEAHPALAEQHYVRSPAQERALQAERRKLQQEMLRAARASARNRIASPLPTTQQLAADVDRLARVREAGRARLRELEQEGETLRQETRQVQQRAMDVIARSEQISAVASRSPSPSPPPRRTRSPSRPSYYSSGAGGAYSRGAFGPPPPYSRSPSASPGRYRPASASPGSAYRRGSPGSSGYADGYYDSPPPPQQQYSAAAYYNSPEAAEAMQRPLSAPGPMSPPPGPGEAQQILAMINSVERLPQHEQVPVGTPPDHLARASTVAASRGHMGLLGQDEQRVAIGAYDRTRYEEYQRQVDMEMQRRAVEGGYDSDLDRDDAAGMVVQDSRKVAEEEEARRRAREGAWENQDGWMDEYRQRFGPEDGYLPSRGGSAGGGHSPGTGGPHGSQLQPQYSVLSDAEEEMLRQPYVPVVSPELTFSPGGYASDGPDGYNPHRRTSRRLFFKSTVPEPFDFEEREKARPKPISKVKLEQDLAIRRAEEDAARKQRFRANPVPWAVVEPRYERMLLEAEVKRQLNQQQRLEELASMMEQPFSFYYRDKDQLAEREALARAAKDPRRFQVAYRARDVPQSTKEERFRVMMLELEAKRDATRRRVEEARRGAKERAEQEAMHRREAASRAYRERLRAVDPALHPYPPKPLGVVPDFNGLHRQNEVAMARQRANIRKRVTVPQEFRLNGSTPDEQVARARKMEERRHRIILDMQLDAELLPEARWPHKSPRGKVRRTPPPAYLVEWMARPPAPGNHAAAARKSSTAVAAQGGAYLTRAEKEEVDRKTSEKLRAEALRRADRLLKAAQVRREQEDARGGGGGGGGGGGEGDFGLLSDVGATAAAGAGADMGASSGRAAVQRRRAAVVGRQDNPEVYVDARHMQIERKVREVVEDALLDQGIEAFRYVEGVGDGKKKAAAKAEAAGE